MGICRDLILITGNGNLATHKPKHRLENNQPPIDDILMGNWFADDNARDRGRKWLSNFFLPDLV